ncbi:MAG: hypothetical protein GY777_25195, partial [Candidatus Brocadiaceae bacterium]|nr:hypothetical protein [Candidatus Brocadiaceae bacterium]
MRISIRTKKHLFRYLVITGILFHLGFAAFFLVLPALIEQPQEKIIDKSFEILGIHPYYSTRLKQLLPADPIPEQLPPFPPPSAWPAQGVSLEESKYPSYSKGIPMEAQQGKFEAPANSRIITVSSTQTLIKAMGKATAGDIITIAPGKYRFDGHAIATKGEGLPSNPIIVRASSPGKTILEFNLLEGFHVTKPYWVFENLEIIGVCNNHSRCEHAFHIVGNADNIIIRNNRLVDFNAAIKVNPLKKKQGLIFPDSGLIERNTIYNSSARITANPVTTLNINSGNNWVVRANFIADFYKQKGDNISYGAFMKGNSKNGIFERNLIVCNWKISPENKVPIALSLGGGGTADRFCRSNDCSTEHRGGIIRNNIIARCQNDVGIYLNKAAETQIYNNIIQGSLGIDVRFPSSSAVIINNI